MEPADKCSRSGAAQQIVVNVTLGGDFQQDILMQGSAVQKQQWYSPTSYATPVPVPASGNWAGALSGYGAADFLSIFGAAESHAFGDRESAR